MSEGAAAAASSTPDASSRATQDMTQGKGKLYRALQAGKELRLLLTYFPLYKNLIQRLRCAVPLCTALIQPVLFARRWVVSKFFFKYKLEVRTASEYTAMHFSGKERVTPSPMQSCLPPPAYSSILHVDSSAHYMFCSARKVRCV